MLTILKDALVTLMLPFLSTYIAMDLNSYTLSALLLIVDVASTVALIFHRYKSHSFNIHVRACFHVDDIEQGSCYITNAGIFIIEYFLTRTV